MSQIIDDLIKEVGSIRFSILSENKIQLEYKVPIISHGILIDNKKVKFRYRKISEDNWVLIPIRERFFNQLSMSYGIKKNKIFNIHKPKLFGETIPININNVEYKLNTLSIKFIFDDISWHREKLINILISYK